MSVFTALGRGEGGAGGNFRGEGTKRRRTCPYVQPREGMRERNVSVCTA